MPDFEIHFRVSGSADKHVRPVTCATDMADAVRQFRHVAPTADIYRVQSPTPGGSDCQGCAADGPGRVGSHLGSRGHREDCPRAHCVTCPGDLPTITAGYRRNPNRPFETQPYLAGNGHRMIASINGRGRVSQSGAWCAEDCAACGGGDQRPDW